MKQNDDSVSIAKAIGIILMVIGHSGCPVGMHHFLSMFHMPLFFFLSGYCFKAYYFDHKKEYLKKRLKSLYLPYVKWAIVFLLLHNIFFRLNIYNPYYGIEGEPSVLYPVSEFIRRALRIGLVMDSQEWLLGGYWFFRDLLVASFISLFALKIIKRENLLIAILLIVSIVLKYIDIHPSEIVSRFFLDSAFFVTGYQIRKNITLIESRLYLAWPCLLIVILGSALSPASLAYFEWWQIPHFYVCAFAGSIMALLFSKWLSGISLERLKRSMVYIGNNTIPILTLHLLCFKAVSLLIIVLRGYSILRIAEFPTIADAPGFWILYLFVGLMIPIGISLIINKISSRNIKR
jgi:fucose 4-O-acetylase-like acetyltransferase